MYKMKNIIIPHDIQSSDSIFFHALFTNCSLASFCFGFIIFVLTLLLSRQKYSSKFFNYDIITYMYTVYSDIKGVTGNNQNLLDNFCRW